MTALACTDALCGCGCGEPTPIATRTKRGNVRGQPARFRPGHFATPPFEDRFWSKVDRSAGFFGCWPWTGALDADGYGTIGETKTGRTLRAPRVAYELTVGPIPAGLEILHSCDNRPCVNPAHLRVGTHAENMAEISLRGRHPSQRRSADGGHAGEGSR